MKTQHKPLTCFGQGCLWFVHQALLFFVSWLNVRKKRCSQGLVSLKLFQDFEQEVPGTHCLCQKRSGVLRGNCILNSMTQLTGLGASGWVTSHLLSPRWERLILKVRKKLCLKKKKWSWLGENVRHLPEAQDLLLSPWIQGFMIYLCFLSLCSYRHCSKPCGTVPALGFRVSHCWNGPAIFWVENGREGSPSLWPQTRQALRDWKVGKWKQHPLFLTCAIPRARHWIAFGLNTLSPGQREFHDWCRTVVCP